MANLEESPLTVQETLDLAAEDMLFFGRVYFPKTFKTVSPAFHTPIAELVDGPDNAVAMLFRGAAKTTLTRVACAKKLSFGETSLTLVVGKSQDHAIKTLLWIKNQVENNSKWTGTFEISKAINKDTGRPKKWTDEWITIWNGVLQKEIHFIAYGITGSIRGMNIDDTRPDFIICDDILDDENCATMEQREKIKDRFTGALMKSLCRKEENPMAKCLMLQTPLDEEDLSMELIKLDSWKAIKVSCFDENGQSTWEEQFSTVSLLVEKADAVQMNKLSVWMREMEVNPIAAELKLFRESWLNLYEQVPEGLVYLLTVDPTPPPKDREKRDVTKLDDAVIMVTGFHPKMKRFYLIEYYATKSPQTTELVSKFFEFYMKYRPLYTGCETHLFQRTVKTELEKEMHVRGTFFTITPIEDKRNKFVRIKDVVQGIASAGLVYVMADHTEFISQFANYPQTKHDDYLDAFCFAIMLINPAMLAKGSTIEGEYELLFDDDEYEALEYGGAP